MGIEAGEFEALRGLLDGGHEAELADFVLAEERFGDLCYQRRPERVGDLQATLVARIREGLGPRPRPADHPQLIFLVSRCRGGTNALMRLFGAAGLLSACQPFKNALRHHLIGERYAWRFPPVGSHPVIWAKTTFGPFTRAESVFDPVGALLAAGYPAERLRLIICDRAPLPALRSWRTTWGHKREAEVLEQNFVLASLNVRRMQRLAVARGLRCDHYVYETNRARERAIPRLFARLGLADRFDPAIFEGWAPRRSPASNVASDPEPPDFSSPGTVSEHPSFDYFDHPPTPTPPATLERLRRHGVFDIYDDCRARTIESLDLSPAELGPAGADR